jgi:phospholipid/cholesterol/gamma-HCH transport system substrate-binding protein
MPRTRSLAWSELKIGLLSLMALSIAMLLIFMLSGEGGFSWQQYGLKAMFTNVPGLKPGAPVRVAGVEVGSVTDVEFAGDKVEVAMNVSKDVQSRITSMSTASLGSVSLLGEAAVDIVPSSSGTPIPEWGYIRVVPAPGITEVTSQATAGLQQATELLADIRTGRGTVGKLFTDETLYNEINGFIVAAEQVASNVNRGRGTLGRLANDPAAAKALEASLQNLEAVTARIRSGEGSLGKLLNDDALSKSLTATTSNLETLTGRINRGDGTAGKLVSDPELYNRLNSMSDRLDKLVMSLQQGEGTAGQLLHDKQLYENMNGAVGEMRALVKDIRADPKKFLNVRVSLF